MFLSNAITAKNDVTYTSLDYTAAQQWFTSMFLNGDDLDEIVIGNAKRLSPIAAAHRIYTNSMSVLPVSIFQKKDGARYPKSIPNLDRILKVRANDQMSPALCKKIIASQAFWHGVGYGWLRFNGRGEIFEIVPLPSEGHTIQTDPSTGQRWYTFSVDGLSITLAPSELLIIFFETFDGKYGQGILNLARETIATDTAGQMYAKKFYLNGAKISGLVEVDGDLGKPGRDTIKKEFREFGLSRDEAFRIAVIDRGMKYTPIGLSQKDAQFIESRNFSVEEVSRFTGIAQYMLQSGKQSYNSNEQQQLDFVTNTLLAHVTQWEQEWTYKVLPSFALTDGYYLKFNLAALLRGDNESRSRFYEKMISFGIYNPDDCRSFEELNPLPDQLGQRFFMTTNLNTVENIVKGVNST